MFNAKIQHLENGQALKLSLFADQTPLPFSDVLQYWQSNEIFQDFFISQLCAAPYPAYFFEMPALTKNFLSKPFECVLVNNSQLVDVRVDAESFSAHFSTNDTVVDFANLSGDARLVAPCPQSDLNHYPHLATFSHQAPLPQQHALWQRVGSLVEKRLSDQPLWLSTSGLGVYWLHIRLDKTPKYYSYQPYRNING